MTISGEELGAELYELRRAGRVKLPEVAAFFAQASRHMHNSSWQEREGFDREWTAEFEQNENNIGFDDSQVWNGNESLGHTATVSEETILSPVFSPWAQVRNQLQTYLARTADRLVAAGAALDGIADAYATTDAEAAAYLDQESEGLEEDVPEVPEVTYPHNPHDTVTEEREVSVSLPNPFGDDTDVTLYEYDVEVPQEEPINPLGES